MDPKACLERLLGAIARHDNSETVQAASDLLCWYLSGGALPHADPGAPAATRARYEVALGLAGIADTLEQFRELDEEAAEEAIR